MKSQPKRHQIEESEGLSPGDFVEDAGYVWRVIGIKKGSVICRRLNLFENLKLAIARLRQRRKEKNGNTTHTLVDPRN